MRRHLLRLLLHHVLAPLLRRAGTGAPRAAGWPHPSAGPGPQLLFNGRSLLPPLLRWQGCSKFDKRKCQEVCIAFTVIIIAFSIGTVGSLYTSDSFDPDAWVASMEETLGVTCEVVRSPDAARSSARP